MPTAQVDELVSRFISEHTVRRIWERDPSVWHAPDAATAGAIRNRLGWLEAPRAMRPHLDRVRALAAELQREHVAAVYLLGMGGSSLCAEVLRSMYGMAPGHPDLFVLDTTDEATLTSVASRLEPARAAFIVASKSGTTIEVSSMERYFWKLTSESVGDAAGRHFIAVTDPDTALEKLAVERGYRATFINPPDIGGRFSALSLFGLVPAAIIGAPVKLLLDAGGTMADGCRQERQTNAGLELGAFMGAAAHLGRDKLTVLLPHGLASLGLWIEQLVAESTGKLGRGLLPVVDAPVIEATKATGAAGGAGSAAYGADRAFIAIETEVDTLDHHVLDALREAGHPVFRIRSRRDALGAEFFRWEFATAVAGAALGVNPFDEPNVTEAKERTKALLAAFERDGRLPEEPAAGVAEVRSLIASMRESDYLAVLSYLPPDTSTLRVVDELRAAVRSRSGQATTFGVGPRYLHSTGQYHKGGPDNGVFLVITADDRTSTPIPGAAYSFSTLKRAQALGDYQALTARGRRVARVHLTGDNQAEKLERLFAEALA